jgi:hypothetical protein
MRILMGQRNPQLNRTDIAGITNTLPSLLALPQYVLDKPALLLATALAEEEVYLLRPAKQDCELVRSSPFVVPSTGQSKRRAHAWRKQWINGVTTREHIITDIEDADAFESQVPGFQPPEYLQTLQGRPVKRHHDFFHELPQHRASPGRRMHAHSSETRVPDFVQSADHLESELFEQRMVRCRTLLRNVHQEIDVPSRRFA